MSVIPFEHEMFLNELPSSCRRYLHRFAVVMNSHVCVSFQVTLSPGLSAKLMSQVNLV
jgi:hypothetical protein